MNLNKLLTGFLVLGMGLSLVACSSNEPEEKGEEKKIEETKAAEEKEEKVKEEEKEEEKYKDIQAAKEERKATIYEKLDWFEKYLQTKHNRMNLDIISGAYSGVVTGD